MTGKQGTSSRGRGKFKKYSRGGGRSFSRGLRPIDDEGNEVSMWSEEAQHKDGTLDEEDEEDEESEEEEEEEEAPKAKKEKPPTREQLKAAKKAKKAAAAAKTAEAEKKVEVGDMPPSSDEEESEDETPAKAAPAKK